MTKPYKKYTKEQLIEAVKVSRSIRQCLLRLNLAPQGGNYETIHRFIRELNLDTSHWTNQGWRKGSTNSVVTPRHDDELFKEGTLFNSNFRKRILKKDLLPYYCSICKLNNWLEAAISLHIDHIDGNRYNNKLNNLRWLCPNCHSQTNTYCRQK